MMAVQLSIRGVSEGTSRRGERYWRVETDLGTFYAWSERVARKLVPGVIVEATIAPRRTGFWHILAACPVREASGTVWQVFASPLLAGSPCPSPERLCLRCKVPIPALHTLCGECLATNGTCVDCGMPLPEQGYAYCPRCADAADREGP